MYPDDYNQADHHIDQYYHCVKDKPVKRKRISYYWFYIQLQSPVIWDECVLQAECTRYGYILTCLCEMPDYLIDKHKLVYIGRGHRKDKHIQERIDSYGQ